MAELSAEATLAAVADAYDLAPPVSSFVLEHAGLNNQNLGVRTAAGDFVVRTHDSLSYRDPASIQYEHEVLGWLAEQGLPFAVPVPKLTRAQRQSFDGPGGRMSLAPKLPGMPLALLARERGGFDETASEMLGDATGRLQVTLSRLPTVMRPGRPLFSELFGFPGQDLDPLAVQPADVGLAATSELDGLFGWWREQAAQIRAFAAGPYRELPGQVCHNDVTPNNVLAENGTVTAVLDFEYVTPSARSLDFVTGLRSVLEYWKDPEPWTAARAYCRGFARHVRLAEREIAAIPELLRLRAAITVLWWMGRAGAGERDNLLASRLGRVQEQLAWQDRADPALTDVVREALRASAGGV
ncbi:MAG: phosphotransferase [Chloroflexota bacterium]